MHDTNLCTRMTFSLVRSLSVFVCGEVIRGEIIAGLIDVNLFSCLECLNSFRDEPLTEQDFSRGKRLFAIVAGKAIMG